jgi:hypothetical protein
MIQTTASPLGALPTLQTLAPRRGGVAISATALAACLAGLAACSDHMALDTRLDGTLKGEVATTIKLEGPIELKMQMQGPTVRYEGTYISDELFEYIKVGEATDEWVTAVFGAADAKTELQDGTEIWRWTYRPVEQQSSMVEVFSESEKEPKLATRSVFVRLRARLVIEKWKG